MSDWLSTPDDNDGYLGLDDPAMPDSAPAPPAGPATATQQAPVGAPAQSAQDDWLSSSAGDQGSGGDWLGGDAAGQNSGYGSPTPGQYADNSPVMDDQGAWLATEHPSATYDLQAQQQAPAYSPGHPAAHSPTQPAAQPAAPNGFGDELYVSQPQLPQVQPNPRSVGGARGQLSNHVLDVEVQVEVGLGNAALTVEEFLEMGRGSVVELDTPVDALIDLRVRGKLIARGQLVSINDSYGMRIVEMMNEEN